jgi:hypothetical protein
MKSYKHYLTEAERTYKWKIKVAEDVTSDQATQLEQVLNQFKLKSLSKPKSLPISENPVNFEGLGAVPVSIMELEISYPATERQIQEVVGRCCGVDINKVFVYTEGQEADSIRINVEKSGKAVLTQEYDAGKSEKIYGDEYNTIMLKSMEKEPTNRNYQFPASTGTKIKTTNDLEQGKHSAMGSAQQNKIPDPYKPLR